MPGADTWHPASNQKYASGVFISFTCLIVYSNVTLAIYIGTTGTCHLAAAGARCRYLAPGTKPKVGKWGIPEKNYKNAVQQR